MTRSGGRVGCAGIPGIGVWTVRVDKDWRQVFSKVLDWSPAAKGMLVVAVLVPIFLQYLLWARYVLGRDDRDQLINVDFYQSQQPVFALMAVTRR